MIAEFSPSDARRILKAIGKGSTPVEFAQKLLVGQQGWYRATLVQMSETAEDRDFEVRFVRARYGGGKTHFLRCLEQGSRASGWVTSYVLLKRDQVELDHFGSFVKEVARTLELPGGGRGARTLIGDFLRRIAMSAGYKEGQSLTLAVYERVKDRITKLCTEDGLPHVFWMALQAAMGAFLDRDEALFHQICDWFGGGSTELIVDPSRFGHAPAAGQTRAKPEKLKPLASSAAEELLKLYALFCQMAGHTGLYIAVDELEMIGRLPLRRKENSFQTLRALVDQNDSRRLPPATCLFLAATPEMFEDPDKFPSYKALQDRIETAPSFGTTQAINYRATVVDLDKTQLEKEDLLTLGLTVLDLYQLAGHTLPEGTRGKVGDIVKQIIVGGYVMARPRLLCKCLTDLMNGTLGLELAKEIALRVKILQEERERELSGK